MRKVRFIGLLTSVIMMSFLVAGCSDSDDDAVVSNTITIPVGVMSAGKDVIIGSNTGTGLNLNGISYAVYVKKADTDYTPADLEGTWHYKELLADTEESAEVNVDEGSIDLVEEMSATIDSTGIVHIPRDGDTTFHAYMGESKEIIVAATFDDVDNDGEEDGAVSLVVFIKTGSDYDYDTDLLGNWYEESIWHSNPVDDYAIVDEKGELVFGADGAFSGDFIEYPNETTATVSGTAELGAAGAVTLTVEDSVVEGLMSAGKDVFTAVDDFDDVGLLVALKKGDSYDLTDFEGTWYGTSISFSLSEWYWAECMWDTISYQGNDQPITDNWADSDGDSDTETFSDYELTISDDGLISIIIDLGDNGSGSEPL